MVQNMLQRLFDEAFFDNPLSVPGFSPLEKLRFIHNAGCSPVRFRGKPAFGLRRSFFSG